MSDQIKKVEVKVYLEGILIPVNQIQILESLGRTPQASLQVPLNEAALDILPRTTVHIFYKDTKTENRWLLIFEGEVAGVSLTKTTATRMVLLDCVTIGNHWEFTSKTGNSLSAYDNAANQAVAKVNVEFTTQATKPNSIPADIEEQIKIVKAMSGDPNTPLVGPVSTEEEVEKLARTATGQLAALSNIEDSLGGMAGLVSRIMASGDADTDTVGILVREISNSFAKVNPGYFMSHVAYRIGERFFGFYNERVAGLMQHHLTTSMVEQRFKNMNNGSTMITAVMQILDLLNYKMITPTAPTYDDDTKAPQSFVLLPNPVSFTPMACNTIFKDEVINANFSRSFLNEPTRMANIVAPGAAIGAGDGAFFNTLILAPTNRLTYNPADNGAASVQLTKEERLRGVNGVTMQNDFDGIVSQIEAERLIKDPTWLESWTDDDNTRDKQRYILDSRRRYLDSEYQTSVLKNRTFNLTTTYSPYRICGMPGMFLDDKFPSVCGTLGQISTTISADGSSTSSINFINPILVRGNKNSVMTSKGSVDSLDFEELLMETGWEYNDTLDKELLKKAWPFAEGYAYMPPGGGNPVILSKGYEKTNIKRGAWLALLRHKLKNPEESKFLNSWFDEDVYFPDKIGEKVYMKMAYGVSYSQAVADGNDAFIGPRQDGGVGWEIKDTVDNKYFKAGDSNLDGSIGKHRSNSQMKFGTGLKDNTENTEWISHFIDRTNQAYALRSDSEKLTFINKFTRRNIITEDKFWKFLIGQSKALPMNAVAIYEATIKRYEATLNDMREHNWNTDVTEKELADYKKRRPRGIRSIMGSLGEERGEIIALQELNGTNANAPFIKERRDSVKALRNSLSKGKQGDYYIDT